MISAYVKQISQLSPTVKLLNIQINDDQETLSFIPGQWVDFNIPESSKVTSYSLVSGNDKQFELAVKKSDCSISKWVHESCTEGSQVKIKIGGSFILKENWSTFTNIFVCGGIGINSVMCMLSYISDQFDKGVSCSSKIYLLYSAKSFEELIFYDRLQLLEKRHPEKFKNQYFITQLSKENRIQLSDIGKLVKDDKTCIYLCAPPSLTDEIYSKLKVSLGENNIVFEKW